MKEKKHKHGEECPCCEHNHHNHDDGCGCGHNHSHGAEINKKDFIFKIACGIVFLVLGYVLSEFTEINEKIPLICFGISYLIVGFNIVKEAVEGIIHGNIFNENLLMGIASIGAFAIGEYTEGCAVVLLYTIGEFLQDMAVGKSRRSISEMIDSKPQSVTVIRNGKNTEVDPETVEAGEEFIVEPGQKIYLDGIIVNGNAEVDMSALTGESIPVSMSKGDEVLSGSVNLDGMLVVKATKPYNQSTTAKILEMIENTDSKKSSAEKFISRFAKIYTPAVCFIALLIIVIRLCNNRRIIDAIACIKHDCVVLFL